MALRVALYNWHTPYVTLLANALPDYRFVVMPTAHAPTGWREDQRPMPPNVTITAAPDAADDVVLLQTPQDYAAACASSNSQDWVYLAHNRHEFDRPMASHLHLAGVPLVCISEMKAQTWQQAGFSDRIFVIPPYVDPSLYEPWAGEDAHILTVANHLRRPLFDLESWLAATRGLPVRLIGEGNDGLPGAAGPAPSWDALKAEYRQARVYLNPTRPPYEDTYNLASLDAASWGMPIIQLRCGVQAARRALRDWLSSQRPHDVDAVRASVAKRFPQAAFTERWRAVLEGVAGNG